MNNIAVLIPHYNNLEDLKKSLDSISNNEQVDIIIVDDGSVQKPNIEALDSLSNIHIIYLEENMGIEHALNTGLKYIYASNDYKYIARLDCGDICHPERFRIQRAFLDNNPDIHLVGTWASFVDMQGIHIFDMKYPKEHEEIEVAMYVKNVFCHPTVMFRKEAITIIGYYPIEFKYAEDYAYFFKFVRYLKVANIPKILLTYQINPNGISLSKRKLQLYSRIHIILHNWKWGLYPLVGLLRNCLIAILPYNLIERLKRLYYR